MILQPSISVLLYCILTTLNLHRFVWFDFGTRDRRPPHFTCITIPSILDEPSARCHLGIGLPPFHPLPIIPTISSPALHSASIIPSPPIHYRTRVHRRYKRRRHDSMDRCPNHHLARTRKLASSTAEIPSITLPPSCSAASRPSACRRSPGHVLPGSHTRHSKITIE
jgi:hypothetical protein